MASARVSRFQPDGVTKFKRLFVGGGRAYAVSFPGFDVFDVTNPTTLNRIGNAVNHGPNAFKQIIPTGSGLGVAAVGVNPNPNDGTHHVSVYDLSDPSRTDQFRLQLPTPGVAKALALHRGLAYVADGFAGLGEQGVHQVGLQQAALDVEDDVVVGEMKHPLQRPPHGRGVIDNQYPVLGHHALRTLL